MTSTQLSGVRSAVAFARPVVGEAEERAVLRVLRSGGLAQGVEVQAFEEEWSDWTGAAASVAVSSGTSALELVLEAMGIGPGDEVIVPAFTFIATAAVVVRRGATPVFADIDPATFCLDPRDVAAALTPRTRAVIVVHLFGHPADVATLRDVLPPGMPVIEDAAQAHGATRHGTAVGASGIATFSFYPTKNMTTAEGGMISADDPTLLDRVRLLRNHGMRAQYEYACIGGNFRMSDLQAAIGRVQLGSLDRFLARRTQIAEQYTEGLRTVQVPRWTADVRHALSCYTVRATDRDELIRRCADAGIGVKVFYPQPLSELDVFAGTRSCPESRRAADSVLSLPIRPDLTDEDVARVIEVVNGAS